jgi:hypothetical protein
MNRQKVLVSLTSRILARALLSVISDRDYVIFVSRSGEFVLDREFVSSSTRQEPLCDTNRSKSIRANTISRPSSFDDQQKEGLEQNFHACFSLCHDFIVGIVASLISLAVDRATIANLAAPRSPDLAYAEV